MPETTTGRPPAQRRQIVESLRNRIVCGGLKPGDRLPSRREIALDAQVSPVTADEALRRLARQGFVETRGTAGRFVAPNLPHVCHFGVVFPELGHARSQFFSMLEQAAGLITSDDSPRRLRLYRGVTPHRDNEDNRRLQMHVRRRVLAGLVFTWPNLSPQGLDEITTGDVPRAILATGQYRPGVPAIYPDLQAWFDRAIDHAGPAPRRVASLQLPDPGSNLDQLEMLERAVRSRGHQTRPHWTQFAVGGGWHSTRNAAHAVQLLLSLPQHERPNVLLVSDDSLVAGALRGLQECDPDRRRDLQVVCHWNWPAPLPETDLPVAWLGFDAREVLEVSLKALEPQRHDRPSAGVHWIPPRFENEQSEHL